MAKAIRPGGVYKVGYEYQDAHGKKVDAPTRKELGGGAINAPAATDTDGALPEDFPGRDDLAAGGLTTLAAVRAASDEDLEAMEGIGPATVKKIRGAQSK